MARLVLVIGQKGVVACRDDEGIFVRRGCLQVLGDREVGGKEEGKYESKRDEDTMGKVTWNS